MVLLTSHLLKDSLTIIILYLNMHICKYIYLIHKIKENGWGGVAPIEGGHVYIGWCVQRRACPHMSLDFTRAITGFSARPVFSFNAFQSWHFKTFRFYHLFLSLLLHFLSHTHATILLSSPCFLLPATSSSSFLSIVLPPSTIDSRFGSFLFFLLLH